MCHDWLITIELWVRMTLGSQYIQHCATYQFIVVWNGRTVRNQSWPTARPRISKLSSFEGNRKHLHWFPLAFEPRKRSPRQWCSRSCFRIMWTNNLFCCCSVVWSRMPSCWTRWWPETFVSGAVQGSLPVEPHFCSLEGQFAFSV